MKDLVLKLDGVSVELQNMRLGSDGAIVCTVFVRFHEDTGAHIPARDYHFSRADILRMTTYLRSHIGANVPHDIEDSPIFVADGVDIQLEALCGEAMSWDDGSFTLRCMLYCGPPDRHRNHYYLGIESEVGVAEVLRWCGELESLAV
jgi:hypothetical protein